MEKNRRRELSSHIICKAATGRYAYVDQHTRHETD